MKKTIELLAPAKNLEYGKAAINFGADAVYIGAPKFNARVAASCSLEEIAALCKYAHKFHCKVYVALNTIIFDNELEEVRKLIRQIYEAEADAIIIQDMGILEMDLPPIQLHTSVQADSFDIERVKFFDKIGIDRVILARELTLEQIRRIKQETTLELEVFVHGSLCVSLSGRCYLSYFLGGRSSNRGECAQPCRLKYEILDKNLEPIDSANHALSIKDLNRSDYLEELIDAGVASFKIEGRLKDLTYVKNVVAYYRKKIDSILEKREDLIKSSIGVFYFPFEPDLYKTFNRGYTDYYLADQNPDLAANTSKSIGEFIGNVVKSSKDFFELDEVKDLTKGDGICFFTKDNELTGFYIERIEKNKVFIPKQKQIELKPGIKIFRNYNKNFEKLLSIIANCRFIPVDIVFEEIDEGFILTIEAKELSLSAKVSLLKEKILSQKLNSNSILIQTLNKTNSDFFKVNSIKINISKNYFFKFSEINKLRNEAYEKLEEFIYGSYNRKLRTEKIRIANYYKQELNYTANVANQLAKKFYNKRGVKVIESGIELRNNKNLRNIPLMTLKFCLNKSNCEKSLQEQKHFVKYLKIDNVLLKIESDCSECLTQLYFEKKLD